MGVSGVIIVGNMDGTMGNEEKKYSRREVLKGALLGVAGLTLAGCAESPEHQAYISQVIQELKGYETQNEDVAAVWTFSSEFGKMNFVFETSYALEEANKLGVFIPKLTQGGHKIVSKADLPDVNYIRVKLLKNPDQNVCRNGIEVNENSIDPDNPNTHHWLAFYQESGGVYATLTDGITRVKADSLIQTINREDTTVVGAFGVLIDQLMKARAGQ
jgi:hypothetical protein